MRKTIEVIECTRCKAVGQPGPSGNFSPMVDLVYASIKDSSKPLLVSQGDHLELCAECRASFLSWFAIPAGVVLP